MNELEMLEQLQFVEPCERAALQFASNGSRRYMALSDLKAPKGHCVWCDAKLTGRKQRWCSDSCVRAAQWRATPQSPAAKVYRLIFEQNWACKRCGLSFEDELRARIRRKYESENKPGAYIWKDGEYRKRVEGDPESKIHFFQVGDNTGDQFQTDHIIPVHLGGAGIEPSNLQVLCVPCHKAKTKEDYSRG